MKIKIMTVIIIIILVIMVIALVIIMSMVTTVQLLENTVHINLYSCIILHVANNGCVSSVVHCLISQKVELGS